MSDHRFTLQLTLTDSRSFETLHMAIGIDEAVRISPKLIDDMRLDRGLGVSSIDSTEIVRTLQTKIIRKELFRRHAERLGALLAERMEDAEGWHDPSRIGPAREELGGTWR